MKLEIGLKFQKYYNENNINNISSCEVRGIVDSYIIILWCIKNIDKNGKSELLNYAAFLGILDVSRARIGAWEECRATPCAEHLLSICHNFNIELKTFLTTLL